MKPLFILVPVYLLLLLSCRPVIAIGWNELAIIGLLFLVLLGPLLLRIYRLVLKDKDASKKERK